MKYIATILMCTLMLASCGKQSELPKIQTKEGTQIPQVLSQEIEKKCNTLEENAKKKFDEANENPNINLEYLGIVYGEFNDTCYLKIQITDESGETPIVIYSLFNTNTEQTYKNYASLNAMELGLSELIK